VSIAVRRHGDFEGWYLKASMALNGTRLYWFAPFAGGRFASQKLWANFRIFLDAFASYIRLNFRINEGF